MPMAVLDACCLIDLLASGRAAEVLQANVYDWLVPIAVVAETKHERSLDPEDPAKTINRPVNLQPLLDRKLLQFCQPAPGQEVARLVQYAAHFRSDGEAMCLAIAETRGCVLATDDRKAIRLGQQAGLTVVSCPELMKCWADVSGASANDLRDALLGIERFAQFRPNPSLPWAEWRHEQLTRG